jgi:hypothetical protein
MVKPCVQTSVLYLNKQQQQQNWADTH